MTGRLRRPYLERYLPLNHELEVIVLGVAESSHQFFAHQAIDDTAELAERTGLVFEIIPRVRPRAEQRH